MLWLRKYSVRMYGHYTLKYSRRHHRHRGIIGNLCTLFNTSQRLKLFYRIDKENLKTIKIWVILNFIFIIFLCWHLAEVLFYLIVIRQFYQQWYKYNPYYHEKVSLPLLFLLHSSWVIFYCPRDGVCYASMFLVFTTLPRSHSWEFFLLRCILFLSTQNNRWDLNPGRPAPSPKIYKVKNVCSIIKQVQNINVPGKYEFIKKKWTRPKKCLYLFNTLQYSSFMLNFLTEQNCS